MFIFLLLPAAMEHSNYRIALSAFIQSIKAGKTCHEYALEVGPTPPVLQRVGVPALPMFISVKAVDKCYFDHGIGEATLARLYDLVSAPAAVYKSDSPHLDHARLQAIVVVTIEMRNGDPLLVAIHANSMLGRQRVNQIKSIYTKKSEVVRKWRTKGLMLWPSGKN
ncbi:hypothetical protein ACLB1G_25085 [Oxalobacteraceae bacterium A2-2]